jgi:hypothetical protein
VKFPSIRPYPFPLSPFLENSEFPVLRSSQVDGKNLQIDILKNSSNFGGSTVAARSI